jgi:hypothetical protein
MLCVRNEFGDLGYMQAMITDRVAAVPGYLQWFGVQLA